MKDTVNTYMAVLIITIVGSGAALLIVNLSSSDTATAAFNGSEANYIRLQQEILNQ